VLAFEPNPFNRERLARNLELNPMLARRIEVLPIAVAARDGETDFVLSPDIKSGMTSGSFLEFAKPPRESGEYANFIAGGLQLFPWIPSSANAMRYRRWF
jgi:hypothetical protein